jgi:hypothetical protein
LKQKNRHAARDNRQTARARIAIGSFSAEAETSTTPKGLLAIGGLVSMMLLAVAPIILAAAVKRRAGLKQLPRVVHTPQRFLPPAGERGLP